MSSANSFTTRECELLAKAITCIKDEFAIDYQKFADVAGFKNSNSSRVAWHGLKKKLEKLGGTGGFSTNKTGGDGGDTPAETLASGKKRKAKKDGDGENEGHGKPAKKGRKSKASVAAPVEASGDDDEESKAAVKKEECAEEEEI